VLSGVRPPHERGADPDHRAGAARVVGSESPRIAPRSRPRVRVLRRVRWAAHHGAAGARAVSSRSRHRCAPDRDGPRRVVARPDRGPVRPRRHRAHHRTQRSATSATMRDPASPRSTSRSARPRSAAGSTITSSP
jgi:hypothetical protein